MREDRIVNRKDTFPAEMGYPRNQWYVAAWSEEVRAGEPLRRVLLDTPVMLYRTDDGKPAALYDRCPHRGAPLSMGKQIGNEIECPYHGIRFGTDGHCTHIPSQAGTPASMSVERYAVVETWKWIWIWMGDQDKADPALIPDHDRLWLTDDSVTTEPFFMLELGCNYQIFNDNLLDSTHLSYVHRGSLDNGGLAESEYQVTEEGQYVLLRRDEPEVTYEGGLAAFYRCKPGEKYSRTHLCEAYMPSTHVAKQWLYEVNNPDEPPLLLCAINTLTPRDKENTYLFHVFGGNTPKIDTPENLVGARHIIGEDVVVMEAVQRCYEEHRDTLEVSVMADKADILGRRIIHRMIEAEASN